MTEQPNGNVDPEPKPPSKEGLLEPLSMIQPVPMNLGTGLVQTPNGNLVLLRSESPTGSHVAFMSPNRARELALELSAMATRADSGLVLPPGAKLL